MTNDTTELFTLKLSMWIDNDEGLMQAVNEIIDNGDMADVFSLAQSLKDYFDADLFGADCIDLNSIAKELLNTAVDFIDWHKLASDLIQERKANV